MVRSHALYPIELVGRRWNHPTTKFFLATRWKTNKKEESTAERQLTYSVPKSMRHSPIVRHPFPPPSILVPRLPRMSG